MRVHPLHPFVLIILIVIIACRTEPAGYQTLHLGEYGLDISLSVPDSARITARDYGIVKDITIRDSVDFSIQIFAFVAPTDDTAGEKLRQLQTAREDPYFGELIREDEDGFIFSKHLDSTLTDYDFRYIRIMGDRELIFQTGLVGTFSLDAVRRMYASARGSRAGS